MLESSSKNITNFAYCRDNDKNGIALITVKQMLWSSLLIWLQASWSSWSKRSNIKYHHVSNIISVSLLIYYIFYRNKNLIIQKLAWKSVNNPTKKRIHISNFIKNIGHRLNKKKKKKVKKEAFCHYSFYHCPYSLLTVICHIVSISVCT